MVNPHVGREILDPGFIRRRDTAGAMPHSSKDEIDAALSELEAKKDLWARLELPARIAILEQILEDLSSVADQWVEVSVQAKATRQIDYAVAEEWAMFAVVLRNVRLLAKSLREIQNHGKPRIPGPITTRPDGQVVVQVFPQSLYDRLMLPGTTAEVWMRPDLTVDELSDSQAHSYTKGVTYGKVALVLGAGNASMLVPSDFLYKLFVEKQVVVLKLNPVNDYLGPAIEAGFKALIENGYMRVIYGGVEEGSYLCHHRTVEEIHMTGSDKTFEAIVFGQGDEGARRKADRKPLIEKRFTGELGNVSPYIIVPGPWRGEDVAAQGEMLARCLVINSGFNCLTPRVIVQSAGWELRAALNDAIGSVLKQVETRKAYYPGAEQRMAKFLSAHPGANQYGSAQAGELPWTYITGLDPEHSEDICFRNEAFCGLFSEVGLEASSVEGFLDRVVDFANQTLWGNLTATIIAHPDSFEDESVGAAIERAVANLRYGMVLINQFAGIGFMAQTTTWGAYPENDIYDVQSGSGVTSNVLMFEYPEKSVVRSPFKIKPDPFALTSRNVVNFAKKLADFQHKPTWRKIPGYLWSAARS